MKKAPDTLGVWVWGLTGHPPGTSATSLGPPASKRGAGCAFIPTGGVLNPPQKRREGVPPSHQGPALTHSAPVPQTADSANIPCGLDSPTSLLISKEGVSF